MSDIGEDSDIEVDTADLDAQLAAIHAERERRFEKARRQARRQNKEQENVLVDGTPVKKGLPVRALSIHDDLS
jgi:hypothetical protein